MIRVFPVALCALALPLFPLGAADVVTGNAAVKPNSLIDAPEVALRKFTVAPGLNADLFAAEPDVRNPVAISIDEHGRVFVVESDRRRSSVFDIRGHKDWLEADFSFRTVQERAEFLKQQISPTNPAVIKRLTGGGRGMFEDFNRDGIINWRDLEVQSERIRLLEDTNGDGRADRVSVFADGFTNLLAGVAAGVLAQRGDIYFACIPDLWKISKSVTSRSVISGGREAPANSTLNTGSLNTDQLITGFGVHIAFGGHDMHGLIFGPDGKLYWSIADRGTDTNLFAKIKNPIPGLTPELLADSGCIFRANPDGSDFEVIAWGLRNPQELAFDEFGNLFTADNNGDGGDKARWHYVIEGADFGWRIGWQWLEARAYQPKMGPWNGERLWHLAESNTAAYLLPPIAHIGHGPAGLAYNPGTGLPPQFDRHFFLCDFPGYVLMWTNIPDGASFKVGPVKNFFGDLGPTDVAFHPGGGVLVSDWFKSFDKSDKGRIYRIHDPATDASKAVQETKRLLAEGMGKRSVKKLANLLGHSDMRVRLEAQWELTRQSMTDSNAFYQIRAGLNPTNSSRLARLHSIFALGDFIGRALATTNGGAHRVRAAVARLTLTTLFDDPDPEIRGRVAILHGTSEPAAGWLREYLFDPSPRVRLAAIKGLGSVAANLPRSSQKRATFVTPATDALAQVLATNSADLYIRHAAVLALARIGDTNALLHAAAFGAPNADSARSDATNQRAGSETGAPRSVRLGVLLALRRLGSPEVSRFLSDSDPQLVLEAARAINDVPIPAAFPQLASLLVSSRRESAQTSSPTPRKDQSGLTSAATELEFFTLRRALNVNFRLGDPTNALALASFAARDDASEPLRIEALELLGEWPKPPARDHFMGLWRPLPPRDAAPAADALRPVLASLLRTAPKEIRLAALRTASALGVKDDGLPTLAADTTQSPELRVEALRVLANQADPRLADALKLALADQSESLRIEATRLQGGPVNAAQLAQTLETGTVAEKQSVLASLAATPGETTDALLAKQLDALLAGTLARELELDVLEAVAKRPPLKPKLAAYEARTPKENPLAAFRPALHGGNAAAGKKIFVENQQIACFRCHKIGGEGGDVGPDLTGLGARNGRDYLLESIVQPNKQVAAGFENVLLEMNNGASYAGLVKSDTDADLVLNSPEDGVMTLKKADIKSRQRGLSAMPGELVTYLSKRELRDLIEFLATSK